MTVLSDRTIRLLCTPPSERPHVPHLDPLGRALYDYAGVKPQTNSDEGWEPMIAPYFATKVKVDDEGRPIASYGQSHAGYDIRCAPEFKLFCGVDGEPIDYKNIREDQFKTFYQDKVVLPPNSFVLSRSIEKVCMPRDVIALCIGKSTPARAAISCLCTPIEPAWSGYVTLEFANTSNQPVILYANEGAVQLVFLKLDRECEVGYNDNGQGKYQGQLPQITLPRV